MDGEGVALTKISLGAPASQRVHVRLPRGSGAVRDVRLNGQSGRDICLVASLGKRLTVVDNVSDSVCASVGLPAPAWCCAWGGWGIGNTENHFGVDPSEDPNLVSVGPRTAACSCTTSPHGRARGERRGGIRRHPRCTP